MRCVTARRYLQPFNRKPLPFNLPIHPIQLSFNYKLIDKYRKAIYI